MPPIRPFEPLTLMFADDGVIPNNPALPLIWHRAAVDLTGSPNPEQLIEGVFLDNGWGAIWRNGIHPYMHYHSMIHEVLGIARGRAQVRVGGYQGNNLDVVAGDVVVLPAGTGHQGLWASPDLVVIGAYPASGQYNLCRGSRAEHAEAIKTIPRVPVPDTDPVTGTDGPLPRLWRS